MNLPPLMAWLDRPSRERGIRFALPADQWTFWSYDDLAELTQRVAGGLVRSGVKADDVVSIGQRAGPEFVATFFGALLAGATPSPLPPPLLFQDAALYRLHTTGALRSARPSIVVTQAELLDTVGECAREAGVGECVAVNQLARARGPALRPGIDRPFPAIALLQFTSGSVGPSRGVRIPFSALDANVAAIRRWLEWSEDDPFGSWLPVYHDMGLIGGLICSVVSRSDLWLMQPEQFVRRPLRYVRCFGEHGARLSVMPNFGLDYVVRRVQPRDLAGCDFSRWRGLVIGAERVDARTLEAFENLLLPFGFDRLALVPAYGLAEATLAVTGVPLAEPWTSIEADVSSLSVGGTVAGTSCAGERTRIVGCGRPLAGMRVAIAGEDGAGLPDGTVGEIVVRGTSVAAGYAEPRAESSSSIADGTLHTGDAGFLVDGQLFVLGRLGDSVKVHGRALFGEDVELALAGLGVPRERVAALLGVHLGRPTVAVLLERFADLAAAHTIVRPLAGNADIVVVEAPSGTIVRTTSGKPKRRQLWRAFVNGTLPGRVMRFHSEPGA